MGTNGESGIPGQCPEVGIVLQTLGGQGTAEHRPLTAWHGPNVTLNGMRSAFVRVVINYVLALTADHPRYFHFGTGTAARKATDWALQYYITAKATGATSAIGASGLTARLYTTLGATEMTGTIREVLLAKGSGGTDSAYPWGRALLNGGTGVTHPSGTQATFYWDFVLGTGQQPF